MGSGTTNSGIHVWDSDSIGMEVWDSDSIGIDVWDSDSIGMEVWDSDSIGTEVWDSDSIGTEVWDSDSIGMEVWDSDSIETEVWDSDTNGLIVLISEICLQSEASRQRLLVVSPEITLTGWDRSSPIICPRDRFRVNFCCIPTLGHSMTFLEGCV